MKMVVIGNGPSVLNKKRGKLIDDYDIVVRLNWPKMKGCEEYVGTKTDVYAMSGHNFRTQARYEKRKKELFDKEVWIFNTHRTFAGGQSVEMIEKSANEILLNYYFGTVEYALKVHEAVGADPTTGIQTIAYVLDILTEYKDKLYNEYFPISIVGFDCFDTLYHYWGPFTESQPLLMHDGETEKCFIEKYIREGKLERI